MKVLWFTNVPFPTACEAVGRQPPVIGGWLPSLGEALLATGKINLHVVTLVAGVEDISVELDGCHHTMIAVSPRHFTKEFWFYPSSAVRQKYRELVTAFQPDVVHIHGTEGSYGLLVAEGDIQTPAVISLQGFLGACHRFESGGISFWDRCRNITIRDIFGRTGAVRGGMLIARRIRDVESRIQSCQATFVGRTMYDRACLRVANPRAVYCHCDEIMRAPFYVQNRDSRQVVPGRIFAPSSGLPRKGAHCLLKAVALLKDDYPHIKVRLPGSTPTGSRLQYGYNKYLHGLIGRLRLEKHLDFLGELSQNQVVEELALAQVFAFPSFADNSPNSLAEAMLVGTPVVASFVGGVPSMVRDQETALCFPVGDEFVMAECLRRVLSDDTLAGQLAANAKIVARTRHNPAKIAERMLEIYSQTALNR